MKPCYISGLINTVARSDNNSQQSAPIKNVPIFIASGRDIHGRDTLTTDKDNVYKRGNHSNCFVEKISLSKDAKTQTLQTKL
jgi:hypothetical protein